MHLFNLEFLGTLPGLFSGFLFTIGLFASSILGFDHTIVIQQPLPVPAVVSTTTPKAAQPSPEVIGTSTAKIKTPALGAQLPVQKKTAAKVVTAPTSTNAASTPALPNTLDIPSVSADSYAIEMLNTQVRAALVNILCTTATGGYFAPISGSGVFIDSRGIILTNSHVAQYFLLKNYPRPGNIQCVIRSGSPAQPLYTAELLYVPPAWVTANAAQLVATHPSGTGEYDYAFLRVTGTVSASVSMPASFPALPMSSTIPLEGAPTLLGAYPAGLLSGQTIQMNLYSSSAVSTVATLYSFDTSQHVDLIAVKGSVVSQTGSSGGALMGLGSQRLLGIIVTETSGTTTADRQLNALTISYIDKHLSQAGMGGLNTFLTGDLAQKAADFNKNVAPGETAQLEAVLKKISN